MMRAGAALVLTLGAVIACGTERTGGPLDYLETCTPGRSVYACYSMLRAAPEKMFPAGRLEAVDVSVDSMPEMRGGNMTGRTRDERVFVYSMRFNVGRDEVLGILETSLGERLGQGVAPVQTFNARTGDFWETAEGYWVCGKDAVAWYSRPFLPENGYVAWQGSKSVDHYVRRVPSSAALWSKIGRALVGLDTQPRTPTQPLSAAEREAKEQDRAFTIKVSLLVGSLVLLLVFWLWKRFRVK